MHYIIILTSFFICFGRRIVNFYNCSQYLKRLISYNNFSLKFCKGDYFKNSVFEANNFCEGRQNIFFFNEAEIFTILFQYLVDQERFMKMVCVYLALKELIKVV